MKLKITPDGNRAHLEINGEFDAAELEELLRNLILLRTRMTPEVPATKKELSKNKNATILIESNSGISISARAGGGFSIWMRHSGIGWMIFEIDNLTAVGINNYLSTRVRPEVIASKKSGQGN